MIIAALDIGGTAIKYCRYDDSKIFLKDSVCEAPTNAPEGGMALMDQVTAIIASMGSFDAIAVSTAGQVDPATGSIIFATDNIPGYTGMQVKKILTERFNVPSAVENDVNSAALGEAFYGVGKEYSDFLCLTYGTGIGGAIIHDRNIYYGSSCSAGEFGHIITHAGGLPCTCGNSGCYETYASTRALTRTVKESSGLELNGREIFAVIEQNASVKDAVNRWIDEIIYGLVSLIHCFNPPCVVLGGGIMNEPSLVNSIREKLYGRIMRSYRKMEIKKASLGNAAGLLGAIHLAKVSAEKRGYKDDN